MYIYNMNRVSTDFKILVKITVQKYADLRCFSLSDRVVPSAIIRGGGVYSYIRVLPDGFF